MSTRDEEMKDHSEVMAGLEHLETRVLDVEERVAKVETTASRVPAIEARLVRHEKVMMEVQGMVRRVDRILAEHVDREESVQREVLDRLDNLKKMLEEDRAKSTAHTQVTHIPTDPK